ncbi:MAG: aminotransferase class IV [Chitinophagaceae bacterium]|nr:aminotransferase class IV [Chitinophagaceae bacterium]
MPGYFVHNGQLFREGKAVISPDNRSFRYGDGLFETIRVVKEKIIFKELHFERLLQGMRLLQLSIPEFFTPAHLEDDILSLCEKNRIGDSAVIRMVVFRSNGGLYDLEDLRPNYIIQGTALPAPPTATEPSEGLVVDICPEATKACNIFSKIKSNNFLPYVMAALYARQNGLDDALVLNQYGRVADATIANVFWIKNGTICTPPLSEGGIAGVTRQYLLQKLPQSGFTVREQPLTPEDLQEADEVFLTNVIKGVRSVGRWRQARYSGDITKAIRRLILELWK